MSKWEWSGKHLDEYVERDKIPLFCKPHIINEYPDLTKIKVCAADISFKDEMTVDLGDMKCVFKNIVNPHTDDGIIIYIPPQKGNPLSSSKAGTFLLKAWNPFRLICRPLFCHLPL